MPTRTAMIVHLNKSLGEHVTAALIAIACEFVDENSKAIPAEMRSDAMISWSHAEFAAVLVEVYSFAPSVAAALAPLVMQSVRDMMPRGDTDPASCG